MNSLNKSKTYKYFLKSKKLSLKWDTYFEVYDKIFSPYKNKEIKFVEIGAANGGSLLMWKKFFSKKSKIIGIDANPESKKLEKLGFKIYIGDQSDPKFWKNFFKKEKSVDIILDDGGHKNIQQISTIHYCLSHIKNGGLLVVEDTATSYLKREFNNPSKYSFINYCNKVIEYINYRSGLIRKNLNKYSKRIYSISFYESIVVFNIDSKKCIKSKSITNKAKSPHMSDFRHDNNLKSLRLFFSKHLKFINKSKLYNKLERKLFYRNLFVNYLENKKIKTIIKKTD